MITKSTIVSAGNERNGKPDGAISKTSAVVLALGAGFLGIGIGVVATCAVLMGRASSFAAAAPAVSVQSAPRVDPGKLALPDNIGENSVQNTRRQVAAGDDPLSQTQVDVSAFLAQAKSRAPAGSTLSKLHVHFVGASGVVDLAAPSYRATVTYRFSQPSIPAVQKSGAPPGVMTAPVNFPDTFVTLEGALMRVRSNAMASAGPRAKSDPHCTIKEVWSAAIADGAPMDAVADISYPADYDGRSWSFNIEGVKFHETIDDKTCKRSTSDGAF